MKNIKQTLSLALCTLVATLAPTFHPPQLHAEDSATSPPARKEEKPRTIPYNGKLVSADPKGMTFRLRGKEKSRVYHVGSETRIIKQGQKATLEEMSEGEMISGSAIQRGDGEMDAVFVRIGPKVASEKVRGSTRKASAEAP